MSRDRQLAADEDAILVRSLALRLPTGHTIPGHAHPWGQIVYATEGVMTVTTGAGAWVVPSHRAAWVPGGTEHSIAVTDRVRMRTLYLRPDLAAPLPDRCRALAVSGLLREIVLEVVQVGMLRDDVPAERRLAEVLVDRIRLTSAVPLQLPWPRDPRARRLGELVLAQLADSTPLDGLAVGCGASARTLERLFRAETGMTFGRWRQQARLLHALRLLATGASVTATGFAVGFASTSAFVAMFRRALGSTPGSWFRDAAAAAGAAQPGPRSRVGSAL